MVMIFLLILLISMWLPTVLYSLYLQGNAGFQEKYLQLLRAGGTRSYRELLALFGLDASEPGFWKQGLTVMENLIDELAEIELEG